jgi:hypothetical protein
MGYSVDEIPYIVLAEKLGVGSADLGKALVRELNKSTDGAQAMPRPSGKVRQLSQYITEDKSCSACYAALIFALSRMEAAELRRLKTPIAIGQGFKGKQGLLGIGRCCSGFSACVKGCPPSAADILAFLIAKPSSPM